MRVARHWIRQRVSARDREGHDHWGEAWGWSEGDIEEARGRAAAAARRVADWLANGLRGAQPARSWQYAYVLDRPPREEIVQEFADSNGDVVALVTRNAYGALVLSTRRLMFVDVDFPPTPAGPGLFKRLFGKPLPPSDREAEALDRVRQWSAANPTFKIRAYRTAAGLRVVVVNRPLEPNGAEALRILEQLGSDRLYRKLCEVQNCFRARLTPKPWRMEDDTLGLPPDAFPYDDPSAASRNRTWQQAYDQAATSYATCRLVETLGSGDVYAEFESLLTLHDALTGVDSVRELA